MQVNYTNSTAFGRIGFANKEVKKVFQEALYKPRFTSKDSNCRNAMRLYSRFLIEKENNRHDRLIKIGMKQIKGKNYFTNATTDEILGTTKRGRQNISQFMIELLESTKK